MPFSPPLAELGLLEDRFPIAARLTDSVANYDLWRGRLNKKGREAKKIIAIATPYPIRSAAIVSPNDLSATWNDTGGLGESCDLGHSELSDGPKLPSLSVGSERAVRKTNRAFAIARAALPR